VMSGKEMLENENLEIELFLDALYKKHGYDFRDYSRAHIRRRVIHLRNKGGYSSVAMMIHDLLRDGEFRDKALQDFSINYTEMFRDPDFYRFLRVEAVEILKTFPHVKVWHAGCATGEEAYSLAIILKEAGIYDRVQIYATDFNDNVLASAKKGIYPISCIRDYTVNYQQSGGVTTFSDYYDSDDRNVMLDKSLGEKIVFANHNLVSDGVFGEMHMILCRNVLIYFNKDLQCRVLELFRESLCGGGVLCLGSKESLKHSCVEESFETFNEKYRVYKLKYK